MRPLPADSPLWHAPNVIITRPASGIASLADLIARAKAEGVYKGRPASIDVAKVRAMRAKGTGLRRIASSLGVGVGTVMRVLGEERPAAA